jgi:hypothetical protein
MRSIASRPRVLACGRALAVVAVLAGLVAPASAAPSVEERWLEGLVARIAGDVAAGRPLVAEVHVPLCDSSLIDCGNAKLGDGDRLETNLYWATSPGFGVWFSRRGAGWKRVLRQTKTGDADVLQVDVYRRTVQTPGSWRRLGAPATFELDVVIRAWRGKAIDRALAVYAADLSGGAARPLKLDDGTTLQAGGAAQIVSWVGHNRLMDLPDGYAWPASGKDVKGTLFIACHTARYIEGGVVGETRVPLLATRDFLFSNAAPFEAVLLAFVGGGGYARMREVAVAAYAAVQQQSVGKLGGIFSNPADRRWKR